MDSRPRTTQARTTTRSRLKTYRLASSPAREATVSCTGTTKEHRSTPLTSTTRRTRQIASKKAGSASCRTPTTNRDRKTSNPRHLTRLASTTRKNYVARTKKARRTSRRSTPTTTHRETNTSRPGRSPTRSNPSKETFRALARVTSSSPLTTNIAMATTTKWTRTKGTYTPTANTEERRKNRIIDRGQVPSASTTNKAATTCTRTTAPTFARHRTTYHWETYPPAGNLTLATSCCYRGTQASQNRPRTCRKLDEVT